jgi:hypothetical protein
MVSALPAMRWGACGHRQLLTRFTDPRQAEGGNR